MAKIAEIVSLNPWWKHEAEFVRYDNSLQKAKPIFFKRKGIELSKGSIYVLRGPRQMGKTTYLKDTIRSLILKGVPPRDIFYLSLDFFTSRREMKNAQDLAQPNVSYEEFSQHLHEARSDTEGEP